MGLIWNGQKSVKAWVWSRSKLVWMTRYGVKTFKDHTGEWVEVRCAKEVDLFTGEETPIPHLVEDFS